MDFAWKAVVTCLVLLPALFVIVKKPEDPEARKWAYGAVGFIMGYWLR